MKITEIVISLVIIGTRNLTSAQASIPVKDGSSVEISGLGKILDIDTSSMITEVGEWIEGKCVENGGSAKNVPKQFLDCIRSLKTDEKTLRQEINVDEAVAKKYCDVVPGLERCMENITVAVAPCLTEPEDKETIDILLNVTSLLPKFICMNEGEDIAKFIAADGIDCVMSKQPKIEACANDTFGQHIMAAQSSSSNFALLSLLDVDLEKCMGMEKFRSCVVPVLQTCVDPAPSVGVDSVLNYLRSITPCEEILSDQVARFTASPESIFGLEIPKIPYLQETKATICLVKKFKDLKGCSDDIPYDLGGCRNVEMIGDCVLNLVNECQATFILNTVDSMFRIVNHALRCDVPGAKEVLRCEALYASSADVVNISIVSLIVALAISL